MPINPRKKKAFPYHLIKGDCLEEMSKISKGSIDLVLTDPPYGTTQCKWDSIIPLEPMWEQLNKVSKSATAIVLFGSEPFSSSLRLSNILNYKYDWIWDKKTGLGFLDCKFRPLKSHENLSVFGLPGSGVSNGSKIPLKYNPQNLIQTEKINTRSPSNILNSEPRGTLKKAKTGYPKSVLNFSKDKAKFHPTQKPVSLMEYLIKTYTNKGETVLDFTMGSGTTGVACINTGRKFIGIELDSKYFQIAEERIEKAYSSQYSQ